MSIQITCPQAEAGFTLLARLLPLIKDSNPDHFAWHVKNLTPTANKSNRPQSLRSSERALGSLKYEVFMGFYARQDDYISVAHAAKVCGHTPARIKSTVFSGLDQGQLERVPLDGAFGYRLTAKGLEALESERLRRQHNQL
jgi:hypothetical protein